MLAFALSLIVFEKTHRGMHNMLFGHQGIPDFTTEQQVNAPLRGDRQYLHLVRYKLLDGVNGYVVQVFGSGAGPLTD